MKPAPGRSTMPEMAMREQDRGPAPLPVLDISSDRREARDRDFRNVGSMGGLQILAIASDPLELDSR